MSIFWTTAALVAVVSAGCSGGFDEDMRESPTPSKPASEEATLVVDDLESAPVPSACEHPAGTLVDGNLPLIPDYLGGVFLSRDADGVPIHLETHLTGKGSEYLALLDCSAGGVAWPQVVVLYGPGPTLLGSIDLRDVEPGPPYGGSEHRNVETWHSDGNTVQATIINYEGAGYDAVTWTGVFRMREGVLTLDDWTYVSGPEDL